MSGGVRTERGVPAAFQPLERAARFPILTAMRERVLVWDGAMGTMLDTLDLRPSDWDGREGCNEILVETRPDLVREVHAAYFDAGADVVETDSFGGTRLVLAEYDLEDRVTELNTRAAQLAREEADRFASATRPRFVAGSMGPTTRLVTLGHVDYDDLHAFYLEQARGLVAGGVDCLQIETCQDLLQAKCAVLACREAMSIESREVPILVTVTIETTGTMLVGSDVAAVLASLEALPVDVLGVNCATGPDLMVEHVRLIAGQSTRFVLVQPNAGLPRNVGGKSVYDLSPQELARFHRRFIEDFGVTAVGGCCGTGPAHTQAIVEAVAGLVPRARPTYAAAAVSSLYGAVTLDQEAGPLIVGERTNANGSKKFREHLLDEDWDGLVEIAKAQAREGAHVLDVCTAYVGRDEVRDMGEVLSRFVRQVPLPIVVDTTQVEVLEAALKLCGGRSLINSINLEDGEAKADHVCRVARRYGAALVALTIDEDGMAKTAGQKLAVAKRIHDIATKRHGLPSDCLLFDPLTFTIGSGDEDSRDAGIQTLDAVAAIKRDLPGVRTILGVSNISFGLAPLARRVLNSVFLAEAVDRGLDSAIVDAARILPAHRIDSDDRAVALDLIYDRRREGYDPLFAFIERFGDRRQADESEGGDEDSLPVEERLKRRIIDGNRPGLGALLDLALETYKPLQIVNEILLAGMKTVGVLFGAGEMQLPFVLQSAETMKAAVRHLEPHMDRVSETQKGKLVLATVRGDVHDIGKNLVDIILTNNGYKVVNLGIKVPLAQVLDAMAEHEADAIGLSGLLVKSTVAMREYLEEMSAKGLSVPVICGGAALNRGYVEKDLREAYPEGSVYYGKDAFTGLHLMDEICGTTMTKTLTAETSRKVVRHETRAEREARLAPAFLAYVEPTIERLAEIPDPPFWGRRVAEASELDLATILRFINKKALYRFQWQYRRGKRSDAEYAAFLAETAEPKFREWTERLLAAELMLPAVVYGFFPCNAEENELVVYDPAAGAKSGRGGGAEIARFALPRQPKGKRLCVADYFLPVEAGRRDVVALSLVTMGNRAAETSKRFFEADRYDDYLHFHGLSVEGAEALAELWHKRIRQQLGIAHDDATDVEGLFKQGYRGSRYSFGYPACPNLADQTKICALLGADEIGVSLTEDWQLVPEQSTSAIVAHHPAARYFNVTVGG